MVLCGVLPASKFASLVGFELVPRLRRQYWLLVRLPIPILNVLPVKELNLVCSDDLRRNRLDLQPLAAHAGSA